jgi:hypothetical protein
LGFEQADCCDAVGRGDLLPESGNRVAGRVIQQVLPGDTLLTSEFLSDELPRNSQSSAGRMCESLSAPELGIRWSDWTCYRENGAIALKKDETGLLIGKPLKGGK